MMKMLLADCTANVSVNNEEAQEYKIILLRAGLNPNDFDPQTEICAAHRRLLVADFSFHLQSNYCRHLDHSKLTYGSTRKDCVYKQITYSQSLSSHQFHGLTIPMGMPLCKTCYKKVTTILDSEPMDSQESEGHTNAGPDSEESKFSNSQESASGNSGDSESLGLFKPKPEPNPERIKARNRIKLLNSLLDDCDLTDFPGAKHFVKVHFDECSDPKRQRQVLQGIARGFVAVLKTASELEDDWVPMWKDVNASSLVEKILGKRSV